MFHHGRFDRIGRVKSVQRVDELRFFFGEYFEFFRRVICVEFTFITILKKERKQYKQQAVFHEYKVESKIFSVFRNAKFLKSVRYHIFDSERSLQNHVSNSIYKKLQYPCEKPEIYGFEFIVVKISYDKKSLVSHSGKVLEKQHVLQKTLTFAPAFTIQSTMKKHQLKVQNSLTRKKEIFEPLHDGKVGMYVCGPTVYSDVHLGNCRTFVSFDVIYRYLKYLGYKVRYVRNITDVGHLVGDVDTGGEDKISKKARLEQLEPMEVVQRYMNGFHEMMTVFNTEKPDIEPRATGHIIGQIKMVQDILDRGYAYVKNGSVYFDTLKFAKDYPYGELSGRKIDELIAESRDDLKGQGEKNNPSDFAIWIKAEPTHLMRWESPWSVGFPGWHLECSVMSTKYLGKHFDIHGGGNDLKFPHHENEVAQNYGACDCAPAKYWLHTNMLLMNGKKMSKSDDNSITPQQLFTGDSKHVSKGYSPMTIRFFMLQSHYASTLDLSDDALSAAEKGYKRLTEANKVLQAMQPDPAAKAGDLDKEISDLIDLAHAEMSDDFSTPRAIGRLFELSAKINGLKGGQLNKKDLSAETLELLKTTFTDFIYTIFGLKDEDAGGGDNGVTDSLMQLIIDMRKTAREQKDWGTSDKIRDALKEAGVQLKDGKEGTEWSLV